MSKLKTGWGIKDFVRTTRCYQIVKIKADTKPAPPAGPLPDDLRNAFINVCADVHTDLSQVGFHSAA
jgi:hypothetical protein